MTLRAVKVTEVIVRALSFLLVALSILFQAQQRDSSTVLGHTDTFV